MSQAFLPIFVVGIFSFTQCVEVTQLVSGFLSKVIALFIAVHLVCLWVQGSLRVLLCHHLGQPPVHSLSTDCLLFLASPSSYTSQGLSFAHVGGLFQ